MTAKIKNLTFFLLLFSIVAPSSAQQNIWEETNSFYPDRAELKDYKVKWGYLKVPIDYENPQDSIKLAVAILENTKGIKDSEAVIYFDGGPGSAGLFNLNSWLGHPIRAKKDVIIFDARGTGFSEPNLCPDLGGRFLEIFAKNQEASKDQEAKIEAVNSCLSKMKKENISANSYNSLSVANDVHSLRKALGYKKWDVYAVSYGTYTAQTYASKYPKEVKSLILDSPINTLKNYYENNTVNFYKSLERVFKKCSENENCRQAYPDLEATFYKVIKDLENNPLTVQVDTIIVSNGKFTFNAEDFKLAIHQSLYNQRSIEIIPLLIKEFKSRNEKSIGKLVSTFASLLNLDYGVYYSVSCNDRMPLGNLEINNTDHTSKSNGKEQLLFYASDLNVCKGWNKQLQDSTKYNNDFSNIYESQIPVLILSGLYDPITSWTDASRLASKFRNSQLIKASNYGHVPGFTNTGADLTFHFLSKPTEKVENLFNGEENLSFQGGIVNNLGVFNLAMSLIEGNLMFLIPLGISLIVLLIFLTGCIYTLFKKKKLSKKQIVLGISLFTCSLLSIIISKEMYKAVIDVSYQNFLILNFGLPENYSYLFVLTKVLLFLVIVSFILFFVFIKNLPNRSVLFSVIFSNALLVIYFLFWNII
jgi:pimeloyl-ACP methyl ester carboxylesterase